MAILSGLNILKTFESGLPARQLAQKTSPHALTTGLKKELERLQARARQHRATRTDADVGYIWANWLKSGSSTLNDLGRRDIRLLCSAPGVATDQRFLAQLEREPAVLSGRASRLLGFVQVYFMHWRPGRAESMERLIKSALHTPSLTGILIEKWRQNTWLFSSDATRQIGQTLVYTRVPLRDLLDSFGIAQTHALAKSVRETAAMIGAQGLAKGQATQTQSQHLEALRWLMNNLLSEPTSSQVFGAAMSLIVQGEPARMFSDFQAELCKLVLGDKRLGDPRDFSNAPKWSNVTTAAKQTFMSWLARRAIEFFFSMACEDHRRLVFWNAYHHRVTDFACALTTADEWKLRTVLTDRSALPPHARIVDVEGSAFLMEFTANNGQKYIIVEGSKSGFAAQVFKSEDSVRAGAGIRRTEFRWAALRNRSYQLNKWDHRGSWEEIFSRNLKDLGIFK